MAERLIETAQVRSDRPLELGEHRGGAVGAAREGIQIREFEVRSFEGIDRGQRMAAEGVLDDPQPSRRGAAKHYLQGRELERPREVVRRARVGLGGHRIAQMLPGHAEPPAQRREGGELSARGGLQESTAPAGVLQRTDCYLGGIVISTGGRKTGGLYLDAGIAREILCRALQGRASGVALTEGELHVDGVREG